MYSILYTCQIYAVIYIDYKLYLYIWCWLYIICNLFDFYTWISYL